MDEFFYRSEAEREAAEYASQQCAAWKKVDKIREAQEGRVEGLRVKEAEDEARAQLIEYNLVEIDALLALIRSALDGGMDWEEIERLVGESAKQGDELASLVLSLDLRNGAIVVALSPDDDDDAGEAALTAAALAVRLDVRQSALANARDYYSGRKAASVKTRKTEEAAEAAVRAAEKKAASQVAHIKVTHTIKAMRSAYWFEKFHWFVSSENLLVIAGRDAQQNELIVKRYLKPKDVYVHADIHGATSCVVKHLGGDAGEIPPLTLAQAGQMTVCRSSAWDSHMVTSAWWVYDHQVSKSAPRGVPSDGLFMIRGKKNYLPPNQLVMGLGLFFRLADDSVERHVEERRARATEVTARREGSLDAWAAAKEEKMQRGRGAEAPSARRRRRRRARRRRRWRWRRRRARRARRRLRRRRRRQRRRPRRRRRRRPKRRLRRRRTTTTTTAATTTTTPSTLCFS